MLSYLDMSLINDKKDKTDTKSNSSDDSSSSSSPELPLNNNPTPYRSFLDRAFGKIAPGSLRGSIFNLVILSLGSGCLALPQTFSKMSLLTTWIFITLCGIASYWTMNIMMVACKKYDIYKYSQLVEILCGKGWSCFLDYNIILYIFETITLFHLISYKLIGGIVNEFGGYGFNTIESFYLDSFWSENYFKFPIMFGITTFILIPLCMLRDVGELRFTSIFGSFSLFLLLGVIFFQSPWYIQDYWDNLYDINDPATHLNLWDISSGFTKDLHFFKGASTIFFAYCFHIAAFPVAEKLHDNSTRRISKVFYRVILINGGNYLLIGTLGYLSVPINTPDLIIERYKLFENDYMMTLGWGCFIITLFAKICANFNCIRIAVLSRMNKTQDDLNFKLNLGITCFFLYSSTLIAALYGNITNYISLTGSVGGVITSFIFPSLLYIRANDYPITHYKNVLTILINGVISLIGLGGAVLTLKDIFSGES